MKKQYLIGGALLLGVLMIGLFYSISSSQEVPVDAKVGNIVESNGVVISEESEKIDIKQDVKGLPILNSEF